MNLFQAAQIDFQAVLASEIVAEEPCRVLSFPIPEDFRINSAKLNPIA